MGGAGVHRGDTLFALIAPTVLSQYGLQCVFQSNEDREKKKAIGERRVHRKWKGPKK